MYDQSPLSPEKRRRLSRAHGGKSEARWFHRLDLLHKAGEILRRVVVGVYTVGFLHAGNFAYMALIATFAFFIVTAAVGGLLGSTDFGAGLIGSFLSTLPPDVAEVLRLPINSATTARSGPVLWLSGLVSLWTTGSLIESVREIQHTSYGTQPTRPFWHYRLSSIVVIIGSVLLSMMAFSVQFLMTGVQEFVSAHFPTAAANTFFVLGRIIPFLVLFLTLYALFHQTCPSSYRRPDCPKWPGAVLVSSWWLGATALLPVFLANVANYDLTYGSLAGAVIALIFFYIIGLGMVTGAQLNAALANEDEAAETTAEHAAAPSSDGAAEQEHMLERAQI